MNFLNLTDTSIPLEQVKEKLTQYCATPWNQVRQYSCTSYTFFIDSYFFTYVSCLCSDDVYAFKLQVVQQHPDVKVKYLAEYCYSGIYIFTLLTKGYNFTSGNYPNIKFIKKVSRGLQARPFLFQTTQQFQLIHITTHFPLTYFTWHCIFPKITCTEI